MRLMTVLRFLVFPVVEPFLQISFLTNLVRQQTGKRSLYLLPEVFVRTQCFGSFDRIYQAFACHGHVRSTAVGSSPGIAVGSQELVFGRCTR